MFSSWCSKYFSYKWIINVFLIFLDEGRYQYKGKKVTKPNFSEKIWISIFFGKKYLKNK